PESASHEKERTADRLTPAEVPADRPADLEAIPDDDGVEEEGRDLAIRDPLHRDVDLSGALGLRRDRVASLRRVAVVGGEADVVMLPRPVRSPVGKREREGFHLSGLRLDGRDHGDLPFESALHQSPVYR